MSKSEAKKTKGQKKQKRERLVPDEPLKQSTRIHITLEEFLPEKLQSFELRAYFKKKREEAVIQVPCLNIVVTSDDEEKETILREVIMPRPMEFEMWKPYENISFQTYELLEGTVEEKLEAALNQRDMGGFRPRSLFPLGYDLPNFSIYKGHGDPEKHIKLFFRQCGRTGQNQALCLRQFPLSLDEIAFN
ncbi:hypothetical protein Vadar_005752 [Vaccinium darrowii]|uniref:Uncharacterized protein n=1 Tax=Vaccinium darrowii TaxID=229202 RepID=A0ACB7Z1N0_9ERIC|nr:hypothetical protein Vadar_005752 [Vaccinium darrowii]